MEEGMLWKTDVMEGPCAVARWKDINTNRGLCLCSCITAIGDREVLWCAVC
jgi:hypothetical protein